MKTEAPRMDRREFFRDGLRYAAVAGLGVVLGRLAARGRRAPDACTGDGICPRCPAFDECGAPQALSARDGLARRKPLETERSDDG
jgi:hypothetical protein